VATSPDSADKPSLNIRYQDMYCEHYNDNFKNDDIWRFKLQYNSIKNYED